MGGNGFPTPRASAIGMELRVAREAAGLSVRDLATRIGVHHTTVSRWETGARMPKPEDVAGVLVGLGVIDERRDELIELARAGDRPQWLGGTQRQVAALLQFEAEADRIVHVAPLLIPGLLQTTAYTSAIMEAAGIHSGEMKLRVAVRIGRRDILVRSGRPRLLALIGEAALHVQVGGREVMRDQLARLAEVAEWESVDIRIVPLAAGWHPGLIGPFIVVERHVGDPVVHLEIHDSGLFLHESEDTARYRAAADMVLRSAMDSAQSRGAIADALKRLATEGNPC
jgi:transcriptional regulator with XRE-family HTH domain